MKALCVYCGSRQGTDPAFAAAARDVGSAIGRRGWRLVYGGGGSGLMGEVADAALAAGARSTGVIPAALMQRELGHRGREYPRPIRLGSLGFAHGRRA